MQNNIQQKNVPKSASAASQRTASHARFEVTPQSINMDISVLQPKHQPCQRRQTSPSASQPCVSIKKEQQHQSASQNMGAPRAPHPTSKSVTELRNSSMASDVPVYKPLCYERRSSSPSSPSSPTTRQSQSAETFVPLLASTAQNAFRKLSAQVSKKISSPSTPTNESESESITECDGTHKKCLSTSKEIPIEHFEQQLQKFRSGSNSYIGGAAEISGQLNDIFINRLKDIRGHGLGDTSLKLVTYQEWVEMLLKINDSILSNVEELEIEVAKRLEYAQPRVGLNCRHSQGNELMQCRKDIDTLIKIIQNGLHSNDWDLRGMSFETVTPLQVFGLTHDELEKRHSDLLNSPTGGSTESADAMQRNKLLGNMKALALEVADKHDEVRDLKRQVVCLEDDIQKAQKKIQLKDDVIKELRTDLKRTAKEMLAKYHINSPQSVDDCVAMRPLNLDDETTRAQNTTGSQMTSDYLAPLESSLRQSERLEQQKISQLGDALNDYCTLSHHLSETQSKHLFQVLEKAELEKNDAYRKLDSIRRHLVNLESSANKAPASQDSSLNSKNEIDLDAKILDGVRKRILSLNEAICDLRLRLQKSERAYNDLSTNMKASEAITQRNEEILKDVAELLCEITGKSFSYSEIYKKPYQSRANPFSDTILAMRAAYQQRETHLLHLMAQKNQKIEELMERLCQTEKALHEHQKQRTNLSEGEDIDKITPPSSLLLQSQQATLMPQSTVTQTSLSMTHQTKENSTT